MRLWVTINTLLAKELTIICFLNVFISAWAHCSFSAGRSLLTMLKIEDKAKFLFKHIYLMISVTGLSWKWVKFNISSWVNNTYSYSKLKTLTSVCRSVKSRTKFAFGSWDILYLHSLPAYLVPLNSTFWGWRGRISSKWSITLKIKLVHWSHLKISIRKTTSQLKLLIGITF